MRFQKVRCAFRELLSVENQTLCKSGGVVRHRAFISANAEMQGEVKMLHISEAQSSTTAANSGSKTTTEERVTTTPAAPPTTAAATELIGLWRKWEFTAR